MGAFEVGSDMTYHAWLGVVVFIQGRRQNLRQRSIRWQSLAGPHYIAFVLCDDFLASSDQLSQRFTLCPRERPTILMLLLICNCFRKELRVLISKPHPLILALEK